MTITRDDMRRLLTSAGFNLAGHITALGLAFVLAPLLVAGLGDRRYGLWSLVESILAYLFLFEGGVGASLVRYVAKFEELHDRESLNAVFSTTLALMSATGVAVLTILAVLAFGWTHPLGVPADLVTDVRWLLLLLGGNLALGLPLGVFPAILDGLGRFPTKVTIRIFCNLAQAVILIWILRTGADLPMVALVISGANLIQLVLQAAAVFTHLPHLRFTPRRVRWGSLRLIGRYTFSALLVMIAARVSFQSDSLVIGAFLSLEAITFFALASKLVEYAKAFLRSAFGVITPDISRWEARGATDAIRRAFLDGTRWTLYLILPVQVGFWMLGRAFLALWIGPVHATQAYPVLAILCVPLALSLAQAVASRILYGIERINGFAAITVAEAILNLLLSLALVSPLGIAGVALGTSIPACLSSVAVIWYVCRLLRVRVSDYGMTCLLRPALAVCIPAAIWAAFTARTAIESWPQFLVAGALAMVGHLLASFVLECGLPAPLKTAWRPTP